MSQLLSLTGGARRIITSSQLSALSSPPRPRSQAQLNVTASLADWRRSRSRSAVSDSQEIAQPLIGDDDVEEDGEDGDEESPLFDSARGVWLELRGKRKRGMAVSHDLVVMVLCAYFADEEDSEG